MAGLFWWIRGCRILWRCTFGRRLSGGIICSGVAIFRIGIGARLSSSLIFRLFIRKLGRGRFPSLFSKIKRITIKILSSKITLKRLIFYKDFEQLSHYNQLYLIINNFSYNKQLIPMIYISILKQLACKKINWL